MLPAFTGAAFLACASAPTTAGPPSDSPVEIQSWTSGPEGFDTHSYWLDTGAEVVVFDAQFTEPLAEALLAAIAARTASPVRWVVVTHPNPDKFNGVAVFQRAGARVVASEATAAAIPAVHAYKRAFFVDYAKMFKPEAYPPEAKIDVTFRGRYVLPLEGAKVELVELEHRGVTSTQTVAVVASARALIVGDLVHHGVHAWLEGAVVGAGVRPDLAAWRLALAELTRWPGYTVFGGRGLAAPVETVVPAQQDYLTRAEGIVRDYVATLGDKRSELSGPNAGAHFAKLRERFQAAFPERGLAYLVEYGIYGLAQAL